MTVDHASEPLFLQVPAYDCAVISNDFGTNNLKRGDGQWDLTSRFYLRRYRWYSKKKDRCRESNGG